MEFTPMTLSTMDYLNYNGPILTGFYTSGMHCAIKDTVQVIVPAGRLKPSHWCQYKEQCPPEQESSALSSAAAVEGGEGL